MYRGNHVDNPLLEEIKVESSQVRKMRQPQTVTHSLMEHIDSKTPYESFIEEKEISNEGKITRENYIIKELVSMGFPRRNAVNLLKYFPIDNINIAIEMLIKGNEGWPHKYIADDNNKCEICGESYSEHIERISDFLMPDSNLLIHESRSGSLNSDQTGDLIIKEEEAGMELECQICFANVDRSKGFNLQCKHVYCNECFQNYLKEAIENGKVIDITCPELDCKVLIKDPQVKKLCSKELYDKYLKFKENIKVNLDKQMKWCPKVNCGKVIKKGKRAKVVCECGFAMCFCCGEAWHKGISCSKNFERMYKFWAKDKNIQKCPKCKIRVEKDHGCNHMKCTLCGYQWCWICGREYSENHFDSLLFGCPMLQFTSSDWGFGRIFLYLLLITIFWPLILLILCFSIIISHLCDLECECWFNIVIFFVAIIAAPIMWIFVLVPSQIHKFYNLLYILSRVCTN